MRRWFIEKLGGYAGLEAALAADPVAFVRRALEVVREMPLPEKNRWLTVAVKKLFNTIGADDVLAVRGLNWTWQGKPLRHEEAKLLKAEVEVFQKSFLYKVITAELKYLGNRKMYLDSQTLEDMVAGKLLVYYTDIVRAVLKRIADGATTE